MAAVEKSEVLTTEQQVVTISHLFEQSIENILHDLLLDVHRDEKVARMQTAVLELKIRAEKIGKSIGDSADTEQTDAEPVETKAAIAQSGNIQLKGNPMTTVKHTRCPNCRLLQLQYPRVGFNSKPPPDPNARYCKNEPMIIIDKHDVHGQRKKGVKVKGQVKGKNKKLRESSPASSIGDPQTPSSSMPDAFDFKEIDYPAAKCPNRNSHLGDHWKAVNLFATHLNGSCWLKRDRAAMREANSKIANTPKDSRANSPKPTAAATNGVKRKAADEKEPEGNAKKKQKTGDLKKAPKHNVPQPSKLREQSTAGDDGDDSSVKEGDTISVAPKSEQTGESAVKLKFPNPNLAKKKPPKSGKKS